MRTTIDIKEDVLLVVKGMAQRQNWSAGQVVSRLLREALLANSASDHTTSEDEKRVGGFRSFLRQGAVITDEQVNALRDAEGV